MEKEIINYGPIELDSKAYRFFPSGNLFIHTDKQIKTQYTKKGARFFFYGQITHDEYELKKLKQFHEYVIKHKVQYNMEFYDQQRILLFLQGNGFKPKQTLQAMQKHLQFRKQYLPMQYETVKEVINKGFFYPVGRDKYFRPILVFNAKLIDWKNVQENVKATVFVHQMMIDKMFIPGQVESWIVIYDLGGMGLSQMPISAIKAITSKMSLNFSGRLGRLYMVNAPGSMWLGWKTVSAFLDPVTVEKIKISKTNTQKTLFEIADPSQVQEKYGGTQPNRTQYWPFKIPAGVFDEKRLISDQQYEKMFRQGKLVKNQIDPKYKK